MEMRNEKLIKRFLFGEMPEDERSEFEEKFIADADLFEQIKATEDELIEKYVREWMDSAEGIKFEQNFLTTPKKQERVEFSRVLIQKLDEQNKFATVSVKKNGEVLVEDISIWDKVSAFFIRPTFGIAGALVLIITVVGGWVLFQNLNKKNIEVVKNQNDENIESIPSITNRIPNTSQVKVLNNNQNNLANNDLIKPINTENKQNKNLDNRKANLKKNPRRTATPKLKKTPSPTKTPIIKKTSQTPIIALFSGTVRSDGKSNILNLPKEAKAATLQLNLSRVDYKIYQAQLTDADGNVLFQKANLKPRNSKINFNISASKLKSGDYLIRLNGKNSSGENESVADFQFRVKR